MVIAFLSQAVPPKVDVGWTPSATIGVIQTIVMIAFGGGGVIGLVKVVAQHLLAMRKIAEDRAARIDNRSDQQNVTLTARVTELEDALRKEREECDRKLDAMNDRLDRMRKEINELVTKHDAFQTSAARVIGITPEMQKMLNRLDAVKGTGDGSE